MPSSDVGAILFDLEDVFPDGDGVKQAILNGDSDRLCSILEKLPFGPETEEAYIQKGPALLYSAYAGHAQCMQLMLEHGADIFASNSDGNTALHLAAGNGHKDCLQVLLERLSNAHQLEELINKSNHRKMTALHK